MASVRSQLRASGAAALVLGCALLAGGCASIPPEALVLSPESMQLRQLQTRRINGNGVQDLLERGKEK